MCTRQRTRTFSYLSVCLRAHFDTLALSRTAIPVPHTALSQVVAIWDIRDASTSTPKLRATGHKDDVMSLSWNPFQEFLLLTASSDRSVRLWDTRNLKTEMHKFEGHKDEVLNGEGRGTNGWGCGGQ